LAQPSCHLARTNGAFVGAAAQLPLQIDQQRRLVICRGGRILNHSYKSILKNRDFRPKKWQIKYEKKLF
jgi:hypothetical protein